MAAQSVRLYWRMNEDRAKTAGDTPAGQWEEVYADLKESIRMRNYSQRTYKTYSHWIGRFQGFLHHKDLHTIDSDDAKRFLSDLAVRLNVAASTQNQAFNALLYLYAHILKREYDLKEGVARAKRRRYIPVVLSRAPRSPYAYGGKSYPEETWEPA